MSALDLFRCAAARVKLRKLAREQAAKEAAAASKSLAERSPHAKEVTRIFLRHVLYEPCVLTYTSQAQISLQCLAGLFRSLALRAVDI